MASGSKTDGEASPLPPYGSSCYDASNIRQLVQRLQPFLVSDANPAGLYKNEVLMVVNLRPTDLMMLDLIVEELDERFTEARQEQILAIVRDVLGHVHGTEE